MNNIKFLWWVRNILFFRDDTMKALINCGMLDSDAWITVRSEPFIQHDVVSFFWFLDKTNPEVGKALFTNLQTTYDKLIDASKK